MKVIDITRAVELGIAIKKTKNKLAHIEKCIKEGEDSTLTICLRSIETGEGMSFKDKEFACVYVSRIKESVEHDLALLEAELEAI